MSPDPDDLGIGLLRPAVPSEPDGDGGPVCTHPFSGMLTDEPNEPVGVHARVVYFPMNSFSFCSSIGIRLSCFRGLAAPFPSATERPSL